MDASRYKLINAQEFDTPSLVYYKDIILKNTNRIIELARGAHRLWPHIKTHKMRDMVVMQRSMGIDRFKCATIAEAEMLAKSGAPHILIAYPLIGTNIGRFIRLIKAFPSSTFYAIGDDFGALSALGAAAVSQGISINVLIDVNSGTNRTGVPLLSVEAFYKKCAGINGLKLLGLHCYDGHINNSDPNERRREVRKAADIVHDIRKKLIAEGHDLPLMIMGTTPSFAIHAEYDDVYLSPGTGFVHDAGYASLMPDLGLIPAAAVLTRVISQPALDLITLDLGVKGISTDSSLGRGMLLGGITVRHIVQNEEHWVFRLEGEYNADSFIVGSEHYVLPFHICSTTALYDNVLIAENGSITGSWDVSARGRKLSI
ncbi:MAG: D-TA family PLP-dependent enzyme [Christensenellales bacterium]|jgi:D-serine deaminase-like pyridoxal phosphate-dependent protein